MAVLMLITGGIGSGKSYVSKVFSAMGVPVYDTDDRTKALYTENAELLEKLKFLLGEQVVSDGKLNKEYMASRLFGNRELMDSLEQLVYPYLLEDIKMWKSGKCAEGVSFMILESAILLEKPIFKGCYDKVLTVRAPMELRISRAMARTNVSRESIVARISNQWSDEQRVALSDFVIESDSQQAILPQVVKVYNELTNSNL